MVRNGLKRRVNIGMLNQWVGEEDDVGNHEDADPLQAPVKESMSWEWLVHFVVQKLGDSLIEL